MTDIIAGQAAALALGGPNHGGPSSTSGNGVAKRFSQRQPGTIAKFLVYALLVLALCYIGIVNFIGLKSIMADQSDEAAPIIGEFKTAALQNKTDNGAQAVEMQKFILLTALEHDAARTRSKSVSSLYIARTIAVFGNTFCGLIMVAVGAIFVLNRLREDLIQASTGTTSLTTSSPGILFAVVGAVLLAVVWLNPQRITATDVTYLGRDSVVPVYDLVPAQGQTAVDEPVAIDPAGGKKPSPTGLTSGNPIVPDNPGSP